MNPSADRVSPLRILLAPFGSEGDVAPLLWLADLLVARGHRVRVGANPYYAELVRARGHELYPAGSAELLRAAMEDPRLWNGMEGSRLVLQSLVDSLAGCAEPFLREEADADLVVGTTVALGAAFAAEARQIPFVRLHLQPSMLRSVGDLPVIGAGMGWLRRFPAPVIRGFLKLVDHTLDGAPLRQINAFRRTLSLPPVRSFYRDVMNGGEALGGLFPEWYAPRQPDWPAGLELFGFPLGEPGFSRPLSAPLARFLAGGDAPVLWTHGSANFHTADFVRTAATTCAQLAVRGIVVGPRVEEAPVTDSAGFLRLNYAALDGLLPRCRALVHHGGIGTLAKAVRAGLPQLIIPRAHDQFDNAARAERLGFGVGLSYGKLSQASGRLKQLLATPSYAERARALGRTPRPSTDVVTWLEAVAARHPVHGRR